jgi:hypothetical protein
VFDLVTAAEAVGDLRRAFGGMEQDLDDMAGALDDGEFPFPVEGASPAQLRAMMEQMERENPGAMAEMRAAIAEAQAEVETSNTVDLPEAQAEVAAAYRGRSTLLVNLVGRANGRPCHLILTARLAGEEGGAQQLAGADPDAETPDGPEPIGIEDVSWIVGSVAETLSRPDPYEVCMMTPRQREIERGGACPVVCSSGQLTLDEASQSHAKGMLRLDLTRTVDGRVDARGCEIVDRADLTLHFNITSANSGQDAEVARGLSDETLRLLGMDPETIEMMRRTTDGNGILR